MSGTKPSDVLEQLDQLVAYFSPASCPRPAWYDGSGPALQRVLVDVRAQIAELIIMKESYGRLYKQIYGND